VVTAVHHHRIVGYSIDSRITSRLAIAALDNATARRGDLNGCILHTDRLNPGSSDPGSSSEPFTATG
jgi:hypothetical protein